MIYDIHVNTIDAVDISLDCYRGKVLLIVNVASLCALTPQYADLEQLYQRYKDQGLVVLGFPCDQFGHQEPGGESEIKSFCSTKYRITFPLFAKIDVNGDRTHPLYVHLKSQRPGIFGFERIVWNFTKFLVDQNGTVTKRFGPTSGVASIEKHIRKLLASSPT